MSALRLAHPEWLAPIALAVIAVFMAVGVARLVANRRRRRLLGDRARLAARPLRSDLALVVAVGVIAIALLGPRIGERVIRVPSNGIDVVFLLDVSRSMDARDVPPSRLDRATRAVAEILPRLGPFDRAGLAAYAGAGVLLTPLTPDREVLAELLSGIDTQLVTPGSSLLGEGVRAAIEAFEAGSERPRVLLVLGDGEDAARGRDLGAPDATRAGVRVVAAAFGTELGATVPDHGVPLLDRSGRTVITRRDRSRLETLATATDGVLFVTDEWGALDLEAVVAAIRRDAGATPGALVPRRVRAVQVVPFALLAFAILLIDGLPAPRGGPLRARARRAAAAAAVLLVAAPSAPVDDAPESIPDELERRVRRDPTDAPGLVALGARRLERGEGAAAARAFLAAAVVARDAREASVAYFDLGVALLEQNELEGARGAFLDALALAPGDEKARFNLEWTLLALREQPAPPPPIEETEPPPPSESPERGTPEAPEDLAGAPRDEPPPALGESQQRRLLERLEDDPAAALRSAARNEREPRRAEAPEW